MAHDWKSHRWLAVAVAAAMILASGACSTDPDPADESAPTDLTTTAPAATGTDALPELPLDVALPIVFVHGFAGSAQQYESQAMRFVANGYPADRIHAYDHDGAGMDMAGYADGLHELIEEVLEQHDVEQVYLVGHSRGTGVSSAYVGDPARAATVAKYVALDGATCPAQVPCRAVTQTGLPGQAHVEVAASPESFALQYEFLVGEAPEVVDIVPQRGAVELSGRAVEFPANVGRRARLAVWEVDAATGRRVGDEPLHDDDLGADGGFGPIEVEAGAHLEWVLSSDDSPVQHHLYLQPYVRSSRLVRLLSSGPDGATRANTNVGDGHAAFIVMRMREWYAADDADLDGDQRDVLTVEVDGGEPVDVMAPFVGNGGIAVHVHDDVATPGVSSLAPLDYFEAQPFQSGVDVFVPAGEDRTVTVTNLPRGDATAPQTIAFPAWPSSGHSISVVFADNPVEG